ncbi:MAG: hypothetical protein ACE37F_24725 [Nannocystaceae bacterium]|nr:hypothetical protein [bacterium]
MKDPKLLTVLACLVAACGEPAVDAADALDETVSARDHDCEEPVEYTLEPESYGALCPFHADEVPPPPPFLSVMNGDREFDGNGPEITIDVSIEAVGNAVVADIHFLARETDGGDSSLEFRPSYKRVIGTVPSHLEIAGFVSDTSSTIQVVSEKAGWETWGGCNDGDVIMAGPADISGGLVASAQLIGDTGSDDISDDANCSCDMRVDDIVFNEIEVLVREAGSCDPHEDPVPTGGPTPGNACGEECESDDDCSSRQCEGGVCVIDCESDAPCTVSSNQGICRSGVWECGECERECITPQPQEEVCDNEDNDCNGIVDDIDPQECQRAPAECGALEFEGETACSGGEQYCKLVAGEDYCSGCDNAGCGMCGATGCIPSADACIPNHWCGGEAGFEKCQLDPACDNPLPQCYLPSDVGVPPDHCYDPGS